MMSFAQYKERRKTLELAKLCVEHGIDLEPLVHVLDRLMLESDLPPDELYREFLQRAANMVGNMAGRAVSGIGNMVNSFSQGYQQGRTYGQPQPQAQPQMGQPKGWSPQEQNPYNRADVNEGPLNDVLFKVAILKRNIEKMASTGHNCTPDFLTQSLDRIIQTIHQVLVDRYGAARTRYGKNAEHDWQQAAHAAFNGNQPL